MTTSFYIEACRVLDRHLLPDITNLIFTYLHYEKKEEEPKTLRDEIISYIKRDLINVYVPVFHDDLGEETEDPEKTGKFKDTDPRAEKWGGEVPYFHHREKDWMKCPKCDKYMQFIFQVTDPSPIKTFGSLQIWLCSCDAVFMGDSIEGFIVKKIYFHEKYKIIPKPKNVVLFDFKPICRWKIKQILPNYVYGYFEDSSMEAYLGADIYDHKEEIVNELEVYDNFAESMMWYCMQIKLDGSKYPRTSLSFGDCGDYMWGDCGVLNIYYKGHDLVVGGEVCY